MNDSQIYSAIVRQWKAVWWPFQRLVLAGAESMHPERQELEKRVNQLRALMDDFVKRWA